ncbi:inositol hexakisphosphate-domain-containing protein [Blastocladiella britannica]|nr:inositol hexakisphosphate-domain-containing protein [Blastocladiella britannica]
MPNPPGGPSPTAPSSSGSPRITGNGRRLSGAAAAAIKLIPSVESLPTADVKGSNSTTSGSSSDTPRVVRVRSLSSNSTIRLTATPPSPTPGDQAARVVVAPVATLPSAAMPFTLHHHLGGATSSRETTSLALSSSASASSETPHSHRRGLNPSPVGAHMRSQSASLPMAAGLPRSASASNSPAFQATAAPPAAAIAGLPRSRSRLMLDPAGLLRPLSAMAYPIAASAANASGSPAWTGASTLAKSAVSKTVDSVLGSRRGAVLTRGLILKSDQFPQPPNARMDVFLQGAPNFRAHDLNVYGVAQPTSVGLATILTFLNCHPGAVSAEFDCPVDPCNWICTREEPLVYINGHPYVLRTADKPLENLTTLAGISGSRLEALEARLRDDLIAEARMANGLVLVHDEVPTGSTTGGGTCHSTTTVIPTWIAATQVQTPRDLVDAFKAAGYAVVLARIPVSPAQPPDHARYLDAYVSVLHASEPTAPVLVSCGAGGGRTTLGCIVSMLIRRSQVFMGSRGGSDSGQGTDPVPIDPAWDCANACDADSAQAMREAAEVLDHDTQNRASLAVMAAVHRAFAATPAGALAVGAAASPMEWATHRARAVDALKTAVLGNYHVIAALVRVLDRGAPEKRRVDALVDACSAMVNLREEILVHRVRATLLAGPNMGGGTGAADEALDRARYFLERYFFLVAFACYVADPTAGHDAGYATPFADWIGSRPEIGRMAESIRRKGGVGVADTRSGGVGRVPASIFRPVDNLAPSEDDMRWGLWGMREQRMGLGEVAKYVLRNRTGMVLSPNTLLKVDFWLAKSVTTGPTTVTLMTTVPPPHPLAVEVAPPMPHMPGASRFRRISDSPIYGVAQPTTLGMHNVHKAIMEAHSSCTAIVWINLREEPLIYLCGVPYVLRDQAAALRNVRSYRGITGDRLERMEDRLRDDVVAELDTYDGRILVHTEIAATAAAGSLDGDTMSTTGSASHLLSVATTGAGNINHIDSDAVKPVWIEVNNPDLDVLTLRQVAAQILSTGNAGEEDSDQDGSSLSLSSAIHGHSPPIALYRVPVTAETPPDDVDFDSMVAIMSQFPIGTTALVVNDQVGLGRTTMGTTMVHLVRSWLLGLTSETTPCVLRSDHGEGMGEGMYPCVHALLRIIKSGLEVKRVVDDAIDQSSAYVNIRTAISDARSRVASATTASEAHATLSGAAAALEHARRAMLYLRRYFMLLVFQGYLDDVPADSATLAGLETFTTWLRRHPEIIGMQRELEVAAAAVAEDAVFGSEGESADAADVHAALEATQEQLTPVEKQTPGDGIALTSEVLEVVQARRGAVLARQMILKHDAFPGCQKLSLPERLDGAPNFRHVPVAKIRSLVLHAVSWTLDDVDAMSSAVAANLITPTSPISPTMTSSLTLQAGDAGSNEQGVCGVAMPQGDGVRRVLERLRARRSVVWTCLREEPCVYVNSKPYVLRSFQQPISNIEMTGISVERVEAMEDRMKADVLAEIAMYGGRLLLHEEEAGKVLAIVPVWESVDPMHVLTPREVFTAAATEAMLAQGPQLDYLRCPITDEQAPIPGVFDTLVARVLAVVDRDATGYNLVFNCQMGRGRTTTCQIIASLIHAILLPSPASATLVQIIRGAGGLTGSVVHLLASELEDRLPASGQGRSLSSSGTSRTSPRKQAMYTLSHGFGSMDDADLVNPTRRYLRGEYKIVTQLLAVLAHGKLAKVVADVCIDACSAMQNLREAIFDYKQRCEAMAAAAGMPATGGVILSPSLAPGASPAVQSAFAKYRAFLEVGLNYLVRYCYLIAFAGYLLEMTEEAAGSAVTAEDDDQDEVGLPDLTTLVLADLAPSPSKPEAGSSGEGSVRVSTTFVAWLEERHEVSRIFLRGNQDFA